MISHLASGQPPLSGPHQALVFMIRNSTYVTRVNTRAIDPATAPSMISRNLINKPSMDWELMTDAQRIGWETYASRTPIHGKHGKLKIIVGYAMFLRSARARLLFHLPVVEDPPSTYGLPTFTPPILTVTPGSPTAQLFFPLVDPWTTDPDSYCLTWCGHPQAPLWQKPNEHYRKLIAIPGDTATFNQTYTVTLHFTPESLTQGIWWRSSLALSDGRLSE